MATKGVNIRIDEDLKAQADTMFESMGLNLSAAVTIFLKRAVADGEIPFTVKINDPFYSESNLKHINNAVKEFEKGDFKQHDLIEVED